MLEIADRLGFVKDFNEQVNLVISDPAFKLDPEKRYSLREILDRIAKSDFGSDHGLEWFEQHGYMKIRMKTEEIYPIVEFKPRVPIYFEHFLQAADEVNNVMRERNITWWDTSDFVALPVWKPGPSYQRRLSTKYDLIAVNYTDALSFKTISPENAWLSELHERHFRLCKLEINTEAANKRGIKDGDLVCIESMAGKVEGVARVTECIHPEVVAIGGNFGSWAKGKPIARGKGIHHNSLVPDSDDRVDRLSGAVEDCVEVNVYKAEETY